MPRSTLIALPFVLIAACGPPEQKTDPPQVATVTFEYRASTVRNEAVADCGVGPTHIHPSWLDFKLVNLIAASDMLWTRTFDGVPAGPRLSVRISDANYCDRDPNGATTEQVYANGVKLTNVVGTPGNGTEPGLAFTVAPDGTVSP